MNRKLLYSIIIVVVVAAGVIGGVRYAQARQAANTATTNVQTATVARGTMTTSILASGAVRARQSAILTWQTSGSVSSMHVKVGDVVTTSQVLAELDPTTVSQNVLTAQADLATAQKALDDLLNSKVPAVQALQAVQNAQKAVDDYTINFPATQAKAQADLAAAQTALTNAQAARDALNITRGSAGNIDAANAAYLLAQQAVDNAQKAYGRTDNLAPNDPQRAQALINLSDAEKRRDAALATLNWYTGTPSAQDIATADANLASAKANLAQAQNNWDQVKDGSNPTDLALLQAQLADAQRAYDRIKNGPDPADVAAAQARVASAQAAANQSKIVAPFGGVVTEVDALPGDQATSGKTAVRVDDINHLLVDLQVSEVDIPNVKVGQPAKMTFDAIAGKSYDAKVINVSMVGAATQGVVNYTVTVQFSKPDANIKPGMTSSVTVTTQAKPNVLMVPNRAIHAQGGQRYVLVLLEGKQNQVPVTVGLTNDTNSEITAQALAEGDEVVVPATTTTTSSTNRTGGFGGGGFGGGGFGGGVPGANGR